MFSACVGSWQVLFLSVHRQGDESFYPKCQEARESNSSHTVTNVALPKGFGSTDFRRAIMGFVDQILDFEPTMIFISAGFDAHTKDPLGGCLLNDEDYHFASMQLERAASKVCEGRMLSVLEGGYDVTSLTTCVLSHVCGMAGKTCPDEEFRERCGNMFTSVENSPQTSPTAQTGLPTEPLVQDTKPRPGVVTGEQAPPVVVKRKPGRPKKIKPEDQNNPNNPMQPTAAAPSKPMNQSQNQEKPEKIRGKPGPKKGSKRVRTDDKDSKRQKKEKGGKKGKTAKKAEKSEKGVVKPETEGESSDEEIQQWVQCAKCDKWRRLQCDQATTDALSDDWECSHPPLNKDCSVPEDEVESDESYAGSDIETCSDESEWGSFGTDVVRYLMVSYNQEDVAQAAGDTYTRTL